MSEQRFTVLDSCRGICAVLVAIFHFGTLGQVLGVDFVHHSWIFVDFFFLLSGFVITHAYADRLNDRRSLITFAIRRLGRVWPLHLFVLVLLIGLECVKYVMPAAEMGHQPFSGPAGAKALAYSTLLLNSTPVWPGQSINGPSWSISAEYWTYLIFGTVMVATTWAKASGLRAVALAMIWMSALALLISSAGRMETYASLAIARCLYSFLAGCLVHRIWNTAQKQNAPRSRFVGSLTEIVVTAAVVLFVIYWASTPLQFLAPLAFGAAVLVYADQAGVLSDLLRRRPFRILGTLSFSIYMTHSFLREVLRWALALFSQNTGVAIILPLDPENLARIENGSLAVFAQGWGAYGLLMVFLAATIGLSAITYRYVEMPGQALFRSIAERLGRRVQNPGLIAAPPALTVRQASRL